MCAKCCCCFCCCDQEVADKNDVGNILKVVTDQMIHRHDDLESREIMDGEGDLEAMSIHSFG